MISGMPFDPEEIDDLDESLLETMDREELARNAGTAFFVKV